MGCGASTAVLMDVEDDGPRYRRPQADIRERAQQELQRLQRRHDPWPQRLKRLLLPWGGRNKVGVGEDATRPEKEAGFTSDIKRKAKKAKEAVGGDDTVSWVC